VSRTSLIRIPLAKRDEIIALLLKTGVPLCPCCRHTELDRDKQDKPWLVVSMARNPQRQWSDACRRCGNACANTRCRVPPPNPTGRGFGLVPRRRRILSRLFR
jgi:hypothetical protein